jgi:peptidoglycan hydrolase CwlO-like protein
MAMKKSLLIAVVAGLVWVLPASAVDEHNLKQQAPGASKPSSTATETGAPAGMMGNMEKMQRQMDQIHATTDSKERQKLMQEHMRTMQENMKAMRGMDAPMMSNRNNMAGGDMMKRYKMMSARMDMMQMMMEQMMQHQNAQESPPK